MAVTYSNNTSLEGELLMEQKIGALKTANGALHTK